MKDLENVIEELKKQEPIFHHPEFGCDRTYFENLTDTQFWEIGASGRRYDRNFVIDTVVKRYENAEYSKNDIWEARDFECREITKGTYLLTYILSQGAEKRLTRRVTLWQLQNNQWKILYHQGTLIQDAHD